MTIQSVNDLRCQAILTTGKGGKGFPADLVSVPRRKLTMLNTAAALIDLRIPPTNHLEALIGDRAGRHSIRVNDQFRLCFVWTDLDPAEVEFTDYH